jgi:hypothetical protein
MWSEKNGGRTKLADRWKRGSSARQEEHIDIKKSDTLLSIA